MDQGGLISFKHTLQLAPVRRLNFPEIGDAYVYLTEKRAYLCKSIGIGLGGVSRAVFLQFPARICGFLRNLRLPNLGEDENQQKSAFRLGLSP